jgi:hypothetical protein|tara:strand:+ start:2459 stop:2908 length:450 start_codon:yes stop_codon:yes gene_type:complete
MAITLTKGAGITTLTNDLELDLYAGSPDNEVWSGTDYPGGIEAFKPRQTDGTAVAGLKLLCVTATIADTNNGGAYTIDVSGEATKIVSFILGDAGTIAAPTGDFQTSVTGALSDSTTPVNGLNNRLTLTYLSDGTGVISGVQTIWLIVA